MFVHSPFCLSDSTACPSCGCIDVSDIEGMAYLSGNGGQPCQVSKPKSSFSGAGSQSCSAAQSQCRNATGPDPAQRRSEVQEAACLSMTV